MKIDKLKLKKIIFISIIVLIAGWWITTRYLISDTAKIRKTIRKVQNALENMDTGKVMKYVSSDYTDEQGLTKRDLFRLMFRYERIYESVRVKIFSADINIFEEGGEKVALLEVKASVEGITAKDKPVRFISDKTTMHQFIFKLRKEGNTWRLLQLVKSSEVLE